MAIPKSVLLCTQACHRNMGKSYRNTRFDGNKNNVSLVNHLRTQLLMVNTCKTHQITIFRWFFIRFFLLVTSVTFTKLSPRGTTQHLPKRAHPASTLQSIVSFFRSVQGVDSRRVVETDVLWSRCMIYIHIHSIYIIYIYINVWRFSKMEVPQNGWF